MQRNNKRQSRNIKSYTDLSDLKDIHKNRKCFICGAGPSIFMVDLSDIYSHVVISVNSAMMLMPWADGDPQGRFWVSNDTLCLKWSYFWKDVLRSNCTKIVRSSWLGRDDQLCKHGFRYFAPRSSQKAPLNNHGKSLCYESSIPTSIDLALLMGCKEIYILGMDHKILHGNSHFWQFWPKEKWPQRLDKEKNFNPEQPHQIRKFQENKKVYLSLNELAERLDAKIYNCSAISVVFAFPKITLDEAISS